MTCAIPSASAASVPGRMAMCQSARLAVRVRIGSMTTTFAPRLRASATNFHMWMFVLMRLQAQMTMYRECTKLSGSMPAVGPTVMR